MPVQARRPGGRLGSWHIAQMISEMGSLCKRAGAPDQSIAPILRLVWVGAAAPDETGSGISLANE